ncbi:MAG: L-threonylcarbamoyladenylate synthase [Candidatus Binatia bacterium]
MAQLLDGSDVQAIRLAAEKLRAGELVAFPTETVYGLGANALDAHAVAHIFAVKNRPHFDPLIVHLPEANAVEDYVVDINDRARLLMERFWPGPLTLVLRKRPCIPDIVTAGGETVAVRVPAHSVALSLLRMVKLPVAAPSANPFGYVSPTTALHVQESLGAHIPLILDGGPCAVGVESTVCAVTDEHAVILRPGGVTLEEIAATIGGAVTLQVPTQSDTRSPGTLVSHYAPRVLLQLLAPEAELPLPPPGERVGLLLFRPRPGVEGYAHVEILSQDGDVVEAAARLFAALRRLDHMELDRVVMETVPEQGIGRAIMDRLRRAAARYI